MRRRRGQDTWVNSGGLKGSTVWPAGERHGLAAAIPMENPHCSCRLTRSGRQSRTSPCPAAACGSGGGCPPHRAAPTYKPRLESESFGTPTTIPSISHCRPLASCRFQSPCRCCVVRDVSSGHQLLCHPLACVPYLRPGPRSADITRAAGRRRQYGLVGRSAPSADLRYQVISTREPLPLPLLLLHMMGAAVLLPLLSLSLLPLMPFVLSAPASS